MLACLEQLIANEPLQLASCTSRTDDGFPAMPNGLPQPHRNMKPVVRYLRYAGASDDPAKPPQPQQARNSVVKPKTKPIFTQE